jgi:hypothetical protein
MKRAMTDRDNLPKSPESIDVGIYGCTKAGKTRFLFQLLSGWERDRRLLMRSETCHNFLATVEAQIKEWYNSAPTAATTRGITVKVHRDGEAPWELVLCDLRGELVADELDQITSLTREGIIPTLVQKCDGFLFFFDPACSEDNLDKHHQSELKRAELFIEYILGKRQNRYLPIVFVQTHLDLWEHDEGVRTRARQWAEQVNDKLRALYDTHLGRYHPVGLVDSSKTSIAISSIRGVEGEKVVERLYDLVRESRKFVADDRKKNRLAFWASVLFVLLLVAVAVMTTTAGGAKRKPPGGNSGKPPAEWTEPEVFSQLDDIEGLLRSHPRGTQLPSAEEAKKLNQHLRWMAAMVARAEEGPRTPLMLSEHTQTRIRANLNAAIELVVAKAVAKDDDLVVRVPVMAAYLEDLQDLRSISENLGRAQSLFWTLQRLFMVKEIASVLKRRHEVASPATAALDEVILKLRSLEQDVGRCKVYNPQAREALVQEIKTAATFCEDRKNSKSYPATFRIVSANFSAVGRADLACRLLTVESPGQPPWAFGLYPFRKNENELGFSNQKSSYPVKLGLGNSIVCGLFMQEGADGGWRRLHDFNVLSEQGPFTALGLPLLLPNNSTVMRQLQWEGYELKLEFSDFPPLPPLLCDSAKVAKEKP